MYEQIPHVFYFNMYRESNKYQHKTLTENEFVRPEYETAGNPFYPTQPERCESTLSWRPERQLAMPLRNKL